MQAKGRKPRGPGLHQDRSETSSDAKLTLLLDFEKKQTNPKTLATVFLMAMDIYSKGQQPQDCGVWG
jgi:hypothetical protein